MYAITGITGQVGGAMARTLLQAGKPVRAVVRDAAKARAFAAQGCEIALADMNDARALAEAFHGAEGVFILPPPNFDPSPGFPEAREGAACVRQALEQARPGKVIHLSTIGAQATSSNLLSQQGIYEHTLADLSLPLTVLRPGWFMENFRWDVDAARNDGILYSFLQPLGRAILMVATDDIGRVAAELIQENWQGRRVVELQGPEQTSPDDAAAAFSRVLGKQVRAQAVPRETWGALFKGQGMNDPMPRIQMLDGFNEGWICFEGPAENIRKGRITLEHVLRELTAS
ncbi:MAG TPA: NmrA family NAD(P)-binding protein [Dyella sp.]|uniref:NmrA family NAD(P)-binding protein n=1 Tax=Dyella sp. TaxID=1869338 RepID=UPI002F952335